MKDLPPVPASPRIVAAESAAGMNSKKISREDTSQLRSRLLEMILQNENRRRKPPSTIQSRHTQVPKQL